MTRNALSPAAICGAEYVTGFFSVLAERARSETPKLANDIAKS